MSKDYKAAFVRDVEERLVTKFSQQEMSLISVAIVSALENYEMSERCTDLVLYNDENERLLKRFAACLLIDGRSQGTITQYIRSCKQLADITQKNYTEMGIYDVRFFLAKLAERGLSERTRDNQRANISAFFQWMVNEEFIPKNPIAALKTIKYKEEVRLAFSDVEVDRIRSACKKPKERALVEILLTTGVRVNEASNLKVDDINKDTCAVHVRHGKGNKERITYTTPVAMRHVSAYICSRKEAGEMLFYNKNHKQLEPGGIRTILNTIAKRAGVFDVHPHRFRRTFATNLYRRGMDVHEIQRLMGHSNINTTMAYIVVEDTKISDSYKRHIA